MIGKRAGREEDMGFPSMDGVAVDGTEYDLQQHTRQTSPHQQKPKALRFVTNYGAPHPKRRRIGAACLTCRKRKTACSGERPGCETCKQNKLECAGYTSDTSAPGHKRNSSDAGSKKSNDPNDLNGTDERSRKAPYQSQHIKQEHVLNPSLLTGNGKHDGCPPPPAPVQEHAQHQVNWAMNNVTNGIMFDNDRPGGEGGNLGSASEGTADNDQQNGDSLFSGPRNRMPYFRWLGPTAIMPGFKQMVVKVKRQDQDIGRTSTDAGAGPSASNVSPSGTNGALNTNLNPMDQRVVENEVRTPLNLPFYDTSPTPPSELITHLATTFFTHLGCNYPFLQRDRFLTDLEEKQVDPVLVDAVCALAARFSTHDLLTQQWNDEKNITPAEYGHAFASRAHLALVDTYACPSPAAVQAALLLAYNEFGESRDSGLWMYLGISIRMAQDLGMHKLEGLKYKGRSGPTPKMIKRESMSGSPELPKLVNGERLKKKDEKVEETPIGKVENESAQIMLDANDEAEDQKGVDEQEAVEQERVDTFWAVFFLDRVVSSGTGRRSTLRDKDIELSFPALDETNPESGWPCVFPALIRIVHLYGRVADLLNSIKEPSDITTETPKRLAGMESQVTNFYQGLSSRLYFDAVNFQHYMKAGEGTNFVLLHFWFHTLIVLLHQPTLLKTFEGRMLQLFPNSQQLSMSSAKTIADILSYSQLMDAKASLGNPFTSQPIYIAACAFLKETAEQSATSTAQSREPSPSPGPGEQREKSNSIRGSRPPSMHGTPTQDKRMSISDLSNQSKRSNKSNQSHRSGPSRAAPTSSPAREKAASHRRNSSTTVEQHKSSDKSEGSALSAAKTASALAKHTLLAKAASQHYQLCYKALESLHTYWAGAKYILTVLDQKFQGVGDPLLYTAEEGESSMEKPHPEPAFTNPGWRRKLSWGPYLNLYNTSEGMEGAQDFWMEKAGDLSTSPGDLSKAIGWTLTGTMNSPNTNLAWHYPSGASASTSAGAAQPPQQSTTTLPGYNSMVAPAEYSSSIPDLQYPHHLPTTASNTQQPPSLASYPASGSAISNQDANDLLLNLHSPYQTNSNNSHHTDPAHAPGGVFAHLHPSNSTEISGTPHGAFTTTGAPTNGQVVLAGGNEFNAWNYPNLWNPESASMQPFSDMMIESQDIDMSMLGLDMMPWFDSYPSQHDMTGFFGPGAPGGGPDLQGGTTQG